MLAKRHRSKQSRTPVGAVTFVGVGATGLVLKRKIKESAGHLKQLRESRPCL